MNEELKPAQELSEILQVRRDKLAALQAAGSDPFQITKFDVSHHSREVVENYASLEGKTVSIAGRMMVSPATIWAKTTPRSRSSTSATSSASPASSSRPRPARSRSTPKS